jgi:hypothetical protein
MIKPPFVLVLLIAVLAAGTACSATSVIDTNPILVAQQPSADNAQTADPPSQATAELTSSKEQPRKQPHLFGLGIGSYTPINSDVRDVFGGTKLRVGLRPILRETPRRMRFMYDVSYYSLWKDDDQAVLVPLTVGVLQGFGQETKLQTYVAVNAGAFYGRVEAPSVAVSESGWGFTANVNVGLIYNKRFTIEGRYEIMDRFAGFKFDSFSVLVAYKILAIRY